MIWRRSHRFDVAALPLALGIVTFVDARKVRRKRDPGRCYLRAGFQHVGFTAGGLWVFQLTPDRFPAPEPAAVARGPLFDPPTPAPQGDTREVT